LLTMKASEGDIIKLARLLIALQTRWHAWKIYPVLFSRSTT
jgi:hypothetical protein